MEKLTEIFEPVGELVTGKLLKEKDLMVEPVFVQAGESYIIDHENVNFSLGAQSSLSVQLFNDENDKDENELLSSLPTSPISFDPATDAFLKYETAIFPKAKGAFSLKEIGFGFEISAGVKAVFYKGHENTTTIQEAFSSDIKNFLTIFKWGDVLRLEIGDALCFNVEGKLNSALKISWSNILAQSLGSLSTNLPKPVTLDINLSPQLTANFSVNITDQFSYFIKRKDENRLSVSVRKIKNSLSTGGVGAKVGVAFSKPEEIEIALNSIFDKVSESLLKKGTSIVESAIEAVSKKIASTDELGSLVEVADLLGLPNPLENLNSSEYLDLLHNRWEKLKGDFKTNISKIAKTNVELSFSYEYKRIKEGSELLAIELPDSSLAPYHSQLLGFNLSNLVDDLGDEKVSDATLISYINQSSLKIEKSWGFGLNLMGKEFLKGRDFEIKEDTQRIDLQKHKQVSFRRATGYNWKIGNKEEGKWLTEVNATMESFSLAKEPTFSEIDLSFYLNLIVSYGKLKKEGELKKQLDMGVLWGSILQEEVESIVDKYFHALKNKAVTFESKLIFSETVTKTIFAQVGHHGLNDVNRKLLAHSFAASMAFVDDFDLRNSVSERESVYWPLWFDFLKTPNQPCIGLSKKAYDHLRKIPNAGSLPQFEKKAGSNNQGIYFADVIFSHPNLYNDLVSCLSGIHGLATCINSNSPVGDHFDRNYSKINAFLSQSFYVRALGSFLGRYASQDPLFSNEVQRIFTISFDEDGETQVINLAVIH